MRHQGVARLRNDGTLVLTRHPLDEGALADLLADYQAKRESDRAMSERMVFYGQTGTCRLKVLLDNVGESADVVSCGTCDNCNRIAAANAPEASAEVTPPMTQAGPPAGRSIGPEVNARIPRWSVPRRGGEPGTLVAALRSGATARIPPGLRFAEGGRCRGTSSQLQVASKSGRTHFGWSGTGKAREFSCRFWTRLLHR